MFKHVDIDGKVVSRIDSMDVWTLLKICDLPESSNYNLKGTVSCEKAVPSTIETITTKFPKINIISDKIFCLDSARLDSLEMQRNDRAILKIFHDCGYFIDLDTVSIEELSNIPMILFNGSTSSAVNNKWRSNDIIDVSFLLYCTRAGNTTTGYCYTDGFAFNTNLKKACFPPNLTACSGSNWAGGYSNGWFAGSLIEEIDIPDAMTNLNSGCFAECKWLKTIDMNNAIGGRGCFANCISLTSAKGRNVTTIDYRMFTGCTSLTDIDFPQVTTISDLAFYECTNLELDTLPESITAIYNQAFYNTKCNFKNLPESVSTLSGFPWSNTSGGQTFPLYNSKVMSWCGYGDLALGNINITEGPVQSTIDGIVTLSGLTIGTSAFLGNPYLKDVKGTGTIGSSTSVFLDCLGLTTISDSMWRMFGPSLPSGSFKGCINLKGNIVVPENITSLELDSLSGMGGRKIKFLGNITNINGLIDVPFREIEFPPSCTSNSWDYFLTNSLKLHKVNLNNFTILQGNQMFNAVYALRFIEFNKMTSLRSNLFQLNLSIKICYLNLDTVPMWQSAPTVTSNVKFYVPVGMKSKYLLDSNWNTLADRIIEVTSEEIESIKKEYYGVDFFGDKYYDTKRKVSLQSTFILDFEKWTSNNSVTILGSGTNTNLQLNGYYIKDWSNSSWVLWINGGYIVNTTGTQNNKLQSIIDSNKSVTTDAVTATGNLNSILPTNTLYLGASNINGQAYGKWTGTLYKFVWKENDEIVQIWEGNENGGFDIYANESIEPQEDDTVNPLSTYAIKPYIIDARRTDSEEMAANDRTLMDIIYAQGWSASPDYMTKEEAAKIKNVSTLFKSAAITDFSCLKYFTGLTSLSNQFITLNTSLEVVIVPSLITNLPLSWDNACFTGCANLKFASIPGVTSIGGSAFSGCANLQNIELSDNLTYLGAYAFNNCKNLELDTLPKTISGELGQRIFENCEKVSFKDLELPNVTSLGSMTFCRCSSIISMSFPNVTSLATDYWGTGVFAYCSSMTTIKLPKLTTAPTSGVFLGCTSLTTCVLGYNTGADNGTVGGFTYSRRVDNGDGTYTYIR